MKILAAKFEATMRRKPFGVPPYELQKY